MRDYDPSHDLYEVLGLAPEAGEEEIRTRVAELRGRVHSWALDEVVAVLLDLEHRTRYDAQRASYRLRRIMRASFPVFACRPSLPSEGDGR